MEPIVTRAPARWIAGSAGQAELLDYANERFGLDHLRSWKPPTWPPTPGPTFAASVKQSVLPLMLRDAQRGGFKLLRPRAAAPGRRTAARAVAGAARYVRDLGSTCRRTAASCTTTPAIPAMTLDMHEDGDHIARHARAATPGCSSSACACCSTCSPRPEPSRA